MEILIILRGFLCVIFNDRNRIIGTANQELLHRVTHRRSELSSERTLLVGGHVRGMKDQYTVTAEFFTKSRGEFAVDVTRINALDTSTYGTRQSVDSEVLCRTSHRVPTRRRPNQHSLNSPSPMLPNQELKLF
jgi:hypothetical protein